MKKIIFLLLLNVCLINIFAIQFKKASGKSVYKNFNNRSLSTVAYHNNSYDADFFNLKAGTHRWAVNFNFDEYYADADTLLFTCKAVSVYLPNPIHNDISFRLANDSGGYPGEIYADFAPDASSELVDGWNTFNLPESIFYEKRNMWVLVDYKTNATQSFIAASEGSGTNSFYYVAETNSYEAHYVRLSDQSINKEFLFSVHGNFKYSDINKDDLEVSDFKYDITKDETGYTISPKGTILNHSFRDLNNVELKIDLYSANSDYGNFGTVSDTIKISNTFAANSSIEIESIITAENIKKLPLQAGQYWAKATVVFENDAILANNSYSTMFSLYNNTLKKNFIEAFLDRTNQVSTNVVSDLNAINADSAMVISYYPNTQDYPYFNSYNRQRFDYFGLDRYPSTMVNGSKKIKNWTDNYTENLASAEKISTFIAEKSRSGFRYGVAGYNILLTLKNQNANIFNWYASSGQKYFSLHMAVLEKAKTEDNVAGYIMRGFITEPRGKKVDLRYGTEQELEFSFDLGSFASVYNESSEFKLVYWVERPAEYFVDKKLKIENQILFFDTINLNEFSYNNLSITKLDGIFDNDDGERKLTYTPICTFKNFGSETVYKPNLEIKLQSSNPGYDDIVKTVVIDDTLQTGEQFTFYGANYPDNEFIFELAEKPSQYQVIAKVYTSDEPPAYNTGNTKIYYFDDFDIKQGKVLAENFLSLNNNLTENIVNINKSFETPDSLISVSYFPYSLDDQFYNTVSFSMFNYYGLNSYPYVVMQQNRYLNPNDETFDQEFIDIANSLLTERSFVYVDDKKVTKIDEGNFKADYIFSNKFTFLYDWYSQNIRFHAILTEEIENDNIASRLALKRLTPESGLAINLNYNLIDAVSLSLNPTEINTVQGDIENKGSIIAFITHENTDYDDEGVIPFSMGKQLLWTDIMPLNSLRGSNNNAPKVNVAYGPNPFTEEINVRLKSTANIEHVKCNIYNIKGQKVKTIYSNNNSFSWNATNSAGSSCASGIYFMKINSTTKNGEKHSKLKKVLYIK